MKTPRYAVMPPVSVTTRQWPDAQITKTPAWCAVDLRDGNQALPNPMTPPQKRRYFKLLCDIGFKEIEIGFHSASADEFAFCRDLIENHLIPDGVVISVLTQARPHLIARTVEALRGVKQGVVHIYIATSELHSQFVFGLKPDEVVAKAVASIQQIRSLVDAMPGSQIGLEFSPEEFTDTPLDFSVRICQAVLDAWPERPGEKVILNLPATVERRLPTDYADMIEEFGRRLPGRQRALISLHTHNDMGMGTAATMLALKAGADRVEGTLFGHGERTGNVDLVTVAMNLEYLGIATGLRFANLPEIRDLVEEITAIGTHPRHPYAGELVFTAFSGSHQDAIHKGLERRDELAQHFGGWKVPYLHVDPGTIGRTYEKFIRINSQSGKGGMAHVMELEYKIKMPRWVQGEFAREVQAIADSSKRELEAKVMYDTFMKSFVQVQGAVELINFWPRPSQADPEVVNGELHVNFGGQRLELSATGNGPIAAFVHCLRRIDGMPHFTLEEYEEESRGRTADAEAITFVLVKATATGQHAIGVGMASNIVHAAVRAIVSGINRLLPTLPKQVPS